jgi:molecular chaperone DnaJ
MECISDVAKKTIKFPKKCLCDECRGTRAAKGTFPTKCYSCGGTGTLLLRNLDSTVALEETMCSECDGYGKIPRIKCTSCSGVGSVTNIVEETIKVPKGVKSDQVLRKEGSGNSGE